LSPSPLSSPLKGEEILEEYPPLLNEEEILEAHPHYSKERKF